MEVSRKEKHYWGQSERLYPAIHGHPASLTPGTWPRAVGRVEAPAASDAPCLGSQARGRVPCMLLLH